MTKREKIAYAKEKFGVYMGFCDSVFGQDKNVFFESTDSFFEFVCFGNNAAIRADKAILDWCIENFADVPSSDIMDGECLSALIIKLREHGKGLSAQELCFLRLEESNDLQRYMGFDFEICGKDMLAELYESGRFTNALLDYEDGVEMLAIAAYKDGEIAALAACVEYYEAFQYIGIDTLDKCRGQGLATHLVKRIALEIESRGQMPLYATWSTNLASVRTALAAGFVPTWVWYSDENVD